MSDTVIRVENLSKKYILGHQEESYKTFRGAMTGAGKSLVNAFNPRAKKEANQGKDEFWALNDVSFEIKQGDRVGIVGRNGAGKSTLLKVLSRITEPTSGSIRIKGRVASLLEVGTGFHPELTGRENVFLNGAILGMGKVEIQRKFDEIVAFAEVEKFLDTPVKRYSSGMYVRLAFAVAAHLEPEILIVDEVLAVGDAKFQKKCLGKMEDVGREGRTVIFVSHNMAVIRQLCNSAVLLHEGKLFLQDSAEPVLMKYISMNESISNKKVISRYGIELHNIFLEDTQTGTITASPIFNRNYTLKLQIKANKPLSNAAIVIRIYDAMHTLASSICSLEEGMNPFLINETVEIAFPIPKIHLFPGQYKVSVIVCRPDDVIKYLEAEECFYFEVEPANVLDAIWPYQSSHGITRIAEGCVVNSAINR